MALQRTKEKCNKERKRERNTSEGKEIRNKKIKEIGGGNENNSEGITKKKRERKKSRI